MGNRRLRLRHVFIFCLLLYIGVISYVTLHITKHGIVYDMGSAEYAVNVALNNPRLMNSTKNKLMHSFILNKQYKTTSPLSVNTYTAPKLYQKIDLNWKKLFPKGLSEDTNIIYIYKDEYKLDLEGQLMLNAIHTIRLDGYENFSYNFEITNIISNDLNKSSYRLTIKFREQVAEIRPNEVKRDYFLHFPWGIN